VALEIVLAGLTSIGTETLDQSVVRVNQTYISAQISTGQDRCYLYPGKSPTYDRDMFCIWEYLIELFNVFGIAKCIAKLFKVFLAKIVGA
jgi:hypothetical protein